jgi:Flp pilus assembly protein TadD
MTHIRQYLLASLCCIALAGCGGNVAGALKTLEAPPQREAANDIPDAPPLNTDRSRTLFLIIVQGLHDTGKPRAAIAYLRQYGKLYPNDPKAQLLLADCLLSTHQETEAAAIYKGLGGAQAASRESGLGRVAASRAAWDEAASFFERAAVLDAANTTYLNDFGFAQIMTGRFDRALGTLHQAHELAPDNGMVRNNLILALHLAGRDAEARSLINTIARPDERTRGAALLSLDAARLHVSPAKPQTLASADIPVKPQASR